MTILQLAALFYLVSYFGGIIGVRSWMLYRRTGINPLKAREKSGISGIVNRTSGFCMLLMAVVAINYVFLAANYPLLVPIPWLLHDWIALAGVTAAFLGLGITAVAQWQMGNSWRLALDEDEKTPLVTGGLYRFSRNPVYAALILSYLGFFLMLPNAVSLCFLVLSYFSLAVKIRLEEGYLDGIHGAAFRDYRARVRRWI